MHVPPMRSEAIVARLHALHPKLIDLSLGRLERLLSDLGDPHLALPPVVHVAGTNGKGSVCAVLRAAAEAAGLRAHVYTSPHLVRFHERVRLAGRLVEEEALAAALDECERVNAGRQITVFEITTAAAFLLFARTPADVLVLEVGLGGRFDATNVVRAPAATAIASISFDHMEFLGDTLGKIAFEKAGIMKPGAPCATGRQHPEALAAIAGRAAEIGAPRFARDRDWTIEETASGLRYADARGSLDLPATALPGPHQADNAGIAVAALRAWNPAWLTESALSGGVSGARWPARLQRLSGRLAAMLPPGFELFLDGGHNPGAGEALALQAERWADRPLHLIVGMKQGKGATGFLRPLVPHATTLQAVAEPGQHLAMPVADIVAASGGVAKPAGTVAAALSALRDAPPGRVLICGSLYLAGEVLKADGTLPE